MNKTIIFGFGHMASFIADHAKNLTVTYRNNKKDHSNVSDYIKFELGDDLIPLDNYDNIIINYPPQKELLSFLKEIFRNISTQKKVIFLSSTSVYGPGESDEDAKLNGMPRSGRYLIDCETFLRDKNVTIIRPGGLVDHKRNPANFFKGNSIPAINHRTNYVHTEDVARFVLEVLDKENDNYNLIAPIQYTKEDFYKALLGNDFQGSTSEKTGKIIKTKKENVLSFKFLYPDLIKYFTSL